MYFLGPSKLDNCGYFHDEAATYLFFDSKAGETRTVMQAF